MRRVLVAIVIAIAAFAAASPAIEGVQTASARSCGDCDFVGDAALVLRGTVTAWDYERDGNGKPIERPVSGPHSSKPEYVPNERPILLDVQVTSVFKGPAVANVSVATAQYDRYLRAEGSPPFPGWAWPGIAGMCFGLAEDPIGRDLLFVVYPGDDGYVLAHAPSPYGQVLPGFSERYPDLVPYPPSVGNSPALDQRLAEDWLLHPALGASFLLLTLALVIIERRAAARPGN